MVLAPATPPGSIGKSEGKKVVETKVSKKEEQEIEVLFWFAHSCALSFCNRHTS